jgi:hypothetical protein
VPENITYFVDESDSVVAQQPGISEVPLQPGFKITVAEGKAPTEYEVVKWSYSLGPASKTPGLVVMVRPLKQYWYARLSEDNQVLLAYFLIAITLVPTAFGLLLYFFNRSYFLALLGWYCRYVVGWALFATGALLPLRIKGWISSQRTLLGTYLALLCPILGIIAAAAWVNVSRPPQPLNWPTDYEPYARSLLQKFETTLPIAASVLPWVALLAKFVGLEFVGKVFEQLAKIKKP